MPLDLPPNLPAREARIIVCEGARQWSTRAKAEDLVLQCAQAGFNVIAAYVTHGQGSMCKEAHWDTGLMPPERHRAVQADIAANPPGYDPFANLIEIAHGYGIEVMAVFTVTLFRQTSGFPDIHPEFLPWHNKPDGYYDTFKPAFRDWMVQCITQVADTYDIDGIMYDYIRTGPGNANLEWRADYLAKTGRDYLRDREVVHSWAEFADYATMRADPAWALVDFHEQVIGDIVRRVHDLVRLGLGKTNIKLMAYGHITAKMVLATGRDLEKWAAEDSIDYILQPAFHLGEETLPDEWDPWQFVETHLEQRALLRTPHKYIADVSNYNSAIGDEFEGRRLPETVANNLSLARQLSGSTAIALYISSQFIDDDAQILAIRNGPFVTPTFPVWEPKI